MNPTKSYTIALPGNNLSQCVHYYNDYVPSRCAFVKFNSPITLFLDNWLLCSTRYVSVSMSYGRFALKICIPQLSLRLLGYSTQKKKDSLLWNHIINIFLPLSQLYPALLKQHCFHLHYQLKRAHIKVENSGGKWFLFPGELSLIMTHWIQMSGNGKYLV